MSVYFTFKGVTSKSKGLVVQTINEPVTPAVKKLKYDPKFMDGSLDYSAIMGEKFYEDKIISYTCRFKCVSFAAFCLKTDELRTWLSGKGTLTTCRGKVYTNAECYDSIDIAPKFYGKYGEFSVSFTVSPFAAGEQKI